MKIEIYCFLLVENLTKMTFYKSCLFDTYNVREVRCDHYKVRRPEQPCCKRIQLKSYLHLVRPNGQVVIETRRQLCVYSCTACELVTPILTFDNYMPVRHNAYAGCQCKHV